MVKPHGRLVLVGSMHYCTYTSSLSTRSSLWYLQLPHDSEEPIGRGLPHLEVGFPLRCLQRLSLPNMATQRLPLAG